MSIFIQIIRLFIEHWILNVIQFWFNYPVYFLKRIWNYDDVHHTSIDQYQSMQYCKLTRSIPYGFHPREKFHLLEPTKHPKIIQKQQHPLHVAPLFKTATFNYIFNVSYYPKSPQQCQNIFIPNNIKTSCSPSSVVIDTTHVCTKYVV